MAGFDQSPSACGQGAEKYDWGRWEASEDVVGNNSHMLKRCWICDLYMEKSAPLEM